MSLDVDSSYQHLDDQDKMPGLEPIAICGMSCRLPGSINSPSSLWTLLKERRTARTARVPSSRFGIDGHYHPNLARPGCFNVAGGYFLDGLPDDLDPTFFGISPVEARWLDPQQRRMLEAAYESLESAGVTLENAAGSLTGVFVGCFTADYQQMLTKEGDFRHSYAATGCDPGIIGARIGHVFDLRGPSMVLNTACSSSIYALHYACLSLRARDCNAAIVGGVNLILTVDQHMNTAKLGVLSPTSTCHTFDASADGYGRAEGVGALYLKRLSDAIRDGDRIRAVIRATAVNSNGKIENTGITHPCIRGQERVIRMAYEQAGLDPRETAYAELHGTGTPVGDPIEVEAVSRAMNDHRPKDQPLLLGAIKPNIGHSEAASGIFAVIKAALMTETAVIPGVALLENLNPAIREREWNVKVQAETIPWPESHPLRRVSVSSFGYGGTNGHVIIESVNVLHGPLRMPQQAAVDGGAAVAVVRSSPMAAAAPKALLCFSAHDKPTLKRNIEAVAKVTPDHDPADLAFTLNLHRSQFSHRAFAVVGGEQPKLGAKLVKMSQAPKTGTEVAMVFMGQGAQYHTMFKTALRAFPCLSATLVSLDRVLARLSPPPTFSLNAFLLLASPDADGSTAAVDDPAIAQPLLTAMQIALVDLLASWGVRPAVSIGHSSGEIAAAYAAGLLSAPEAIVIAFLRGRALAENAEVSAGAMLAVGLGVGALQATGRVWADDGDEDLDDWCVACENSPESTTVAGSAAAVQALESRLDAQGVFVRRLRTDRAYHSRRHMGPVGATYLDMLQGALVDADVVTERDKAWRQPRTGRRMVSTVTGSLVQDSDSTEVSDPRYWVKNLCCRVQFRRGVEAMGALMEESGGDDGLSGLKTAVEIGPHATLKSPFLQTAKAAGGLLADMTHLATLVRHKDDEEQLLTTAGSLHVAGYPVDLAMVNRRAVPFHKSMPHTLDTDAASVDGSDDDSAIGGLGSRSSSFSILGLEKKVPAPTEKAQLVVDLPPYQWNYYDRQGSAGSVAEKKRFWAEPRASAEQRARAYPRHDVLGSRVSGLSDGFMVWRNILRHQDLPWLRDHNLGGTPIFPAAGYMGMAIEAIRQVFETKDRPLAGVRLRQVEFQKALALPEQDNDGVEVVFGLRAPTDGGEWHEFSVESLPANAEPGTAWTLHCVGKIAGLASNPLDDDDADAGLPDVEALTRRASPKRWYEALSRVGFGYGPTFQQLRGSVRTGRDKRQAAAQVGIADSLDGVVEGGESRYMLHPSTVDACLQLIIVSVHAGRQKSMPWGVVPTKIDSVSMCFPRESNGSTDMTGQAVAWTDESPDGRRFNTHVHLHGPDGGRILEITSLACVAFQAAVPPEVQEEMALACASTTPFFHQAWKPDVLAMSWPGTKMPMPSVMEDAAERSALARLVELIHHHRPVKRAMVCGHLSRDFCEATMEVIEQLSETNVACVTPPPSFEDNDDGSGATPADGKRYELLVVVSASDHNRLRRDAIPRPPPLEKMLENFVDLEGWMIGSLAEFSPRLPASAIRLGPFFAIARSAAAAASTGALASLPHHPPFVITHLTPSGALGRTPPLLLNEVRLLGHGGAHEPLAISSSSSSTGDRMVGSLLIDLTSVSELEEPDMLGLKAALGAGLPALWLTRGVNEGRADTDSFDRMAAGLLRVVRSESPGAKITLLDVDFEQPLGQVARVAVELLGRASTKDSRADTEYWLHNGSLCVPRVYPREDLNEQYRRTADDGQASQTMSAAVAQEEEPQLGGDLPGPDDEFVQRFDADFQTQLQESLLSPAATYVLVGCLGGLGRSLASWMMDRGARHFVFVSRSGADKPEAARIVASIEALPDASARVLRADVSDSKVVERLVRQVVEEGQATLRPVRGVIHAAMVLEDAVFANLTHRSFRNVTRPKVRGAANLYYALSQALSDPADLDFFIVTSSISAVLGNLGQASYAAANSLLDSLSADQRGDNSTTSPDENAPAADDGHNKIRVVSLALPMVSEIGVVAEGEGDRLETSLRRRGMYGIDEDEMLSGFETAMMAARGGSASRHIIMGLDPHVLARTITAAGSGEDGDEGALDLYWYSDARLAHVRAAVESVVQGQAGEPNANNTSGSGPAAAARSAKNGLAGSIRDAIAREGEEAGIGLAAALVAKRMSTILMIPVESISLDGQSLASIGLDSMIGTEMRSFLFREFGLDLPFQELLAAGLTAKALARDVVRSLGGVP